MSAPPQTTTSSSLPSAAAPARLALTWMAAVRRTLAALSIVNLTAVLALLVLLCVVSERWWFSMALGYLPRAPFLLPSCLLMAAALLLRRRRWVCVNLFSVVLVAGPIMGLRVPWGAWMSSASGPALTVVTCNLQAGKGDLTKIVRELEQIQPDVLVLQEATYGFETIQPFLKGWSRIHLGEYVVASKYPVNLRDVCRTEAFGRATAILCEIEGPNGPFLVCDVHLTTARHGLTHLRLDAWQRSSLPARNFAALVGASRHTLYSWQQQFEMKVA